MTPSPAPLAPPVRPCCLRALAAGIAVVVMLAGLRATAATAISYDADVLSTLAGGISRGVGFRGALTLDLDVAWENRSPRWAFSAHASVLHLHGSDLSGRLVGDAFGVSSIQASPGLRLFETWVDAEGLDEAVSLRVGRLAADGEFGLADSAALFLNSAFGWTPTNGEAAGMPDGTTATLPVWPFAANALRLRIGRPDSPRLALGFFECTEVDPKARDPHGLRFDRPGRGRLAWIAEAGTACRADGDPATTLKIGYWRIAAPTRPPVPGPARTGNSGWYLVLEHPLQGTALTAFAHLGRARADRNALAAYWDVGVSLARPLPGRDDDTLGLAVACGLPSGAARLGNGAAAETVVELTYAAKLTRHLVLQPDIQLVRRPGAPNGSAARNALVAGTRVSGRW